MSLLCSQRPARKRLCACALEVLPCRLRDRISGAARFISSARFPIDSLCICRFLTHLLPATEQMPGSALLPIALH